MRRERAGYLEERKREMEQLEGLREQETYIYMSVCPVTWNSKSQSKLSMQMSRCLMIYDYLI